MLRKYSVGKSSVQSVKFVRNRRRKNIWMITLGVISITTWAFVVSKVSELNIFNISNIEIVGADADIKDSLEATVLGSIEGKYSGLFPRSNSFIYPKDKILEDIRLASPRILDVGARLDGLDTLVVRVIEKTPVAVICPDLPNWTESDIIYETDSVCYQVDEQGFIFKRSSKEDLYAYPTYYIPSLKSSNDDGEVIGTFATSTENFRKLQSFVSGMASSGIKPLAVLLKGSGEYELYADPENDEESNMVLIYFNERNNFENELANFIAFWSNLKKPVSQGENRSKFDYIDLRYGQNVFYKQEEQKQ